MCGRFSLKADLDELSMAFPGVEFPPNLTPRYNIAPTQPVAVITNAQPQRVEFFRWGLIPAWAQDPAIGARMINARAESLAVKPAFRAALRRRRCLILADGFYEWRQEPGGRAKTPFYIRLKSGQPFAFAGLWELWQPAASSTDAIYSCTIITTAPNALIEPIHDRMPVILDPASYAIWLDVAERRPDELNSLFKPYPASQMTAYTVSKRVNDPKNDGEECIRPFTTP